jgi:histidinol-phosphate aminotransferase
LKELLAGLKGVEPNEIFVGNGSDEVIDLLFRVFCDPGKDKALTFTPTYGMYDVSAAINDIEMIKVPLTSTFEIDLEQILAKMDQSAVKLTFICSPNNPTGNAFPLSTIETILQASPGIVVIDEAYIDFSTTDSAIQLIGSYPNLFVTQTMSKARGLAAARVGFAFANSAIINLLNKVKPPYNVSTLNQRAAIEALSNELGFEDQLKTILQERSRLTSELSGLSIVQNIYPSEANFLLVAFDNVNNVYNELVDRRIIVRNRNSVVKNCIRITVGTPEENTLLINTLKQLKNEKSTLY